ncbi:hypothetical protein D9K05_26095 [Escherichia coli]|nr:hypothetical protein [Escherichia coli]
MLLTDLLHGNTHLWDALRMNMMISYQELVRTFLNAQPINKKAPEWTLPLLTGLMTHISKRLVRTVLIFTESSDQLSRATDRVPGLPASPGYVQ